MIRPLLIWHPTDKEQGLEQLRTWTAHLSSATIKGCLAVSTHNLRVLSSEELQEFCVHEFELDPAIDRYEKQTAPSLLWSPWGIKSGPNLQFFRALSQVHTTHGDCSIVLIEPDTYLFFGSDLHRTASQLLATDDVWVMGARVHPSSRQALAPFLHQHVNGHAFYRLTSEFMAFLEFVWIPSLLLLTRKYPEFAFDCITPEVAEADLPRYLRDEWTRRYSQFLTKPNMINASNLHVENYSQVTELVRIHLSSPLTNPEGIDRSGLWSLHVKGFPQLPSDLRVNV